VCDLAGAHVLALQYLLDRGESITVNLGSGEGVSVRQVIESVQTITGRDVAVRNALGRPGDPLVLVADPKLARKVLGWVPEQSDLATIIADAWRLA
jgi:UDP-glucose 4-epimerase